MSSLLRSGESADLQAWVTDLRRIQSQGQATPGSVQAYLHSLIVSAQRWLIRAATSIGYTSPVKVEETYDIRELTKNPEKVLVDSLRAHHEGVP